VQLSVPPESWCVQLLRDKPPAQLRFPGTNPHSCKPPRMQARSVSSFSYLKPLSPRGLCHSLPSVLALRPDGCSADPSPPARPAPVHGIDRTAVQEVQPKHRQPLTSCSVVQRTSKKYKCLFRRPIE